MSYQAQEWALIEKYDQRMKTRVSLKSRITAEKFQIYTSYKDSNCLVLILLFDTQYQSEKSTLKNM